MPHGEYFVLGLAGAASLELLRLYRKRDELRKEAGKFEDLLRSPLNWLIVAGMLVASGFVAWALNTDAGTATTWQVVLSGMAARAIARDTSAIGLGPEKVPLGSSEGSKITLQREFPDGSL